MTSEGYLIDQGNAVSFSGLPLTYNSFTDIQLTKPTGIIKVGSTNEMEIQVTPKNSIPTNGTI